MSKRGEGVCDVVLEGEKGRLECEGGCERGLMCYWVGENIVWIDIVFLHQPPGVFNV